MEAVEVLERWEKTEATDVIEGKGTRYGEMMRDEEALGRTDKLDDMFIFDWRAINEDDVEGEEGMEGG